MSTIYRLVYASKNLIVGPGAEARRQLDQILDSSRRHNARRGVTGALIFNGAAFGHVLEGPRRALEETFERIQRDIRHGEVTVLAWGPVAAPQCRQALDFVGETVRARALWSDLLAAASFDLSRLDGEAVAALLQRLAAEVAGAARSPAAPALAASSPAPGLARADPPAIPASPPVFTPRTKAPAARPKAPQVAPQGPPASREARPVDRVAPPSRSERHAAVAVAILKAALADERSRTNALRAEVDELRIVIAAGRAEAASLRAERDLWAERARLMAAGLRDNPDEIRMVVRDAADSMIARGTAAPGHNHA